MSWRRPQPPPPPAIPLTAEERQAFRETPACAHCGGHHLRACPRIKSLTFDPASGKLAGVEFWPWGWWPTGDIVWPEDIEDVPAE